MLTGLGAYAGVDNVVMMSATSGKVSSLAMRAIARSMPRALIGFAENDTQSRNFCSSNSALAGFEGSPGTLVGVHANT